MGCPHPTMPSRRTDARSLKISNGRASERREAYGQRLVPNAEEDWIHVQEEDRARPGPSPLLGVVAGARSEPATSPSR